MWGSDDIYTGNGVSELITMSMQGLLNNGDEILMPSPDYPLWTAAANLAGGHPVHYMCDEAARLVSRTWMISGARSQTGPRESSSSTPTTRRALFIRGEVLQEIVDIAREHQLIIFADEIYDRLVMDGEEHISDRFPGSGPFLRDPERPFQIPPHSRLSGWDGCV